MSPLLLAPDPSSVQRRSVALVNDFTSYVLCQTSTLLILAYGLIGDACTCPVLSHLRDGTGGYRRHDEHRLCFSRIHRAWACALVTLRSTSRTAAGSVCASPARHEARERTVHQERYNPLKVGFQPQDPSAKVQQDFGVRSVTWLA